MEASASNLLAALVNGSFVIFAACFANDLREFRFRVEAGADGGAALRQRMKIFHRHAQPRDAAFDLRGVAGKFLPQRQRRRVLGVGAPDLDDFCKRLFLPAQLAMQFAERGNEIGEDAAGGRDMHRRRK